MSVQDALIRNDIDLTQYTGFPVYFFDFGVLQAHVPKIANWSRDKFETVIGSRIDNMLARADVRLTSANGFHIIFSCREPSLAQERANAICTDILKQLFGTDSLIPESARAFCRLSDLQSVAAEIGAAPPPLVEFAQADAPDGRGKPVAPEQETAPSLMADMNALLRRHFGEEKGETRKFQFAPIWDSANERIASFCCQPMQSGGGRFAVGEKTGVPPAVHCASDIAGLAFALKGVWHIINRGDLALVTVPVHIETLSWSKQRAAYLHELAHIEPRFLGLLAFRVYGLDTGHSTAQLSQGVSVLRRHARRIFAHLPTVSLDFSNAGIIGVTGLGVSAPTHQPRIGESPLDGLAAVASRLKRICAGQNAIAYIDNVYSAGALALLKSQGVRLISGPIFEPPSEWPGPLKSLPLSSISGAARTGSDSTLVAM